MSNEDLAGAQSSLCDLIEKRLASFVKKSNQCGEKDLYNLLMPTFEKPLLTLALRATGWNQIQAAHLLGIHRNTLRRKMKALKIECNGAEDT